VRVIFPVLAVEEAEAALEAPVLKGADDSIGLETAVLIGATEL
jgi:hypothetical protein